MSYHNLHLIVFAKLGLPKFSVVYDTLWRFAVERQRVFFQRFARSEPPWTSDPILQTYRFTNVYRAADRVSQYLIRNVIYSADQRIEEVFFRTILFKLFNRISTWELLLAHFGEITSKTFSFETADRILQRALDHGLRIYSAAYIMPSGRWHKRKHQNHLYLLKKMMQDGLAARLAAVKTMADAFWMIRSYPMLGDFLSYQFVTDLNYSAATEFSEMEFVAPGPGALEGIRKCFLSIAGLDPADVVRLVTDRQELEFEARGIHFPTLFGRRLQLIDVQNLFCEIAKYSRVRHPDILGESNRVRIKQRFQASSSPINYWFPPKWGLNDAIPIGSMNPRAFAT